jgi:hypothetical protein
VALVLTRFSGYLDKKDRFAAQLNNV